MEWIAVVTALALLEYLVIATLVGLQRQRTGVAAPATTGDPIFERYFRVQQNTLEQLIVFIPSLWVFARWVHPPIGAALGLVWIAGRLLYLRAYVQDPERRGPGFVLSFGANVILLLGGLIGALIAA